MDKVLIAVSSFSEHDKKPLDMLRKEGFGIKANTYGRRLKEQEIIELGRDCAGIVAGLEPYNKEALKALPGLKVISRVGAGVSNIDLKAAAELGIEVCNTPEAPARAVAELAVGLILSLLRNIPQMDKLMKQGEWERLSGNLVEGKTVGIVGAGRIGRCVAKLLKGFDARVIWYDNAAINADISGEKKPSLEKVLEESDMVMLHLSGERLVIGRRELGLMKKTAYIVNLSRGLVIDEEALYEALKNRKIAGAALDVFCEEPYDGPLKDLDNVILTPHIGSYTRQTRLEMESQAASNLIAILKSQTRTARK